MKNKPQTHTKMYGENLPARKGVYVNFIYIIEALFVDLLCVWAPLQWLLFCTRLLHQNLYPSCAYDISPQQILTEGLVLIIGDAGVIMRSAGLSFMLWSRDIHGLWPGLLLTSRC